MTNSNLVPNKFVEFSSNHARILLLDVATFCIFLYLKICFNEMMELGMSRMVALHSEAEVADWCSKSDRHFLERQNADEFGVDPNQCPVLLVKHMGLHHPRYVFFPEPLKTLLLIPIQGMAGRKGMVFCKDATKALQRVYYISIVVGHNPILGIFSLSIVGCTPSF